MKVLLILSFLCTFRSLLALRCYSCSIGENDLDQRCVTDPTKVEGNNIITCNKNYCTTIRQEFLEPKGKVASMSRGCEDKPIFLNEVSEDATHRTYYTSCQTDLCNGGSGKDTSTGGLIGDTGDDIVLIVPGIGVNAAAYFSSLLFLVVTTTVLILRLNLITV